MAEVGGTPARFATRRNLAALPNSVAPQAKSEISAAFALPSCPRVRLRIRADEREPHAPILERAQRGVDAGEQGDGVEVRRLEPPHVPGDPRHLPQRHGEARQDLAGAGAAQYPDILLRDPTEAEPVGHIVHVPAEPRQAVGQRAVEVEDGETVAHAPGIDRGVDAAIARKSTIPPRPCAHLRPVVTGASPGP
jgi:hypothetical protein